MAQLFRILVLFWFFGCCISSGRSANKCVQVLSEEQCRPPMEVCILISNTDQGSLCATIALPVVFVIVFSISCFICADKLLRDLEQKQNTTLAVLRLSEDSTSKTGYFSPSSESVKITGTSSHEYTRPRCFEILLVQALYKTSQLLIELFRPSSISGWEPVLVMGCVPSGKQTNLRNYL